MDPFHPQNTASDKFRSPTSLLHTRLYTASLSKKNHYKIIGFVNPLSSTMQSPALQNEVNMWPVRMENTFIVPEPSVKKHSTREYPKG